MEQINRDALFCDETEDYRCPSEADAGEVVTFYFRTEKNGADAVVLLEYDPETGALLQEWQMKRLSWECCAGSVGNGADTNRGIDGSGMADKSDSRFDYYSCALTLGTKTFSYVFQVTWGENVCLRADRGCGGAPVSPDSGISCAGVEQGRADVSDLCGSVLQRRSYKRYGNQ
jgi:alpha-glucosidase